MRKPPSFARPDMRRGALPKAMTAPAKGNGGQADLFGVKPKEEPQKKPLSLAKLATAAQEMPLMPEDRPSETRFVELKCSVTRVIYESANGYRVYAVKGKNGLNTNVSITSDIIASRGDKIIVRGNWSTYKGKPTFKAIMLVQDIPKGARGVVTWLKTKSVPGVGTTTADQIARYFGDRLVEVIEQPEELCKAGISLKKAEAIAAAWENNVGQPELIEYLGKLGLGEMTIAKIVKRYGGAARRIIENNPWRLCETIDGIGFSTADAIAREANHKKDSPKRIAAGILYALSEKTGSSGHTCLPRHMLIQEATSVLMLPAALVSQGVEEVLKGEDVYHDEERDMIYPFKLYRDESRLAQRLKQFSEEGVGIPHEVARDAVEKAVVDLSVNRDEGQIQAAIMAVSQPLSIITGGPGTGKSTTQKIIVRALSSLDKTLALAAPTGRAAKRLSEVSGREASTCHRLLEFSAEKNGFVKDESNPLKQDRIIIDEFSMVDIRLCKSFMLAVKPTGGVTIVGDIDQLPSVGPGQVLRDMIESGGIPVARLETVHRQSDDSGIVIAAARINKGLHPVPDEDMNGFEIETDPDLVSSSEAIRKRVVDLMSKILPERGFDPIADVQVLSPMRKGDLGIVKLNEDLKNAINPAIDDGNSYEIRNRVFTRGDRVMHLRNDYTKEAFNGEVGTVIDGGKRFDQNGKAEPYIRVDYSGHTVSYNGDDIIDVEHALATTVHKSQGCEFPVVIFLCPDAHKNMLSRNLTYTAVTRAKKLCIVVGHESALMKSVRSVDEKRRYSGLANRIISPAPLPDNSPSTENRPVL